MLAWRSQDKRFNETKRSKYSPFPSQAKDLPPLCWLGGLRASGSTRQNDQNIALPLTSQGLTSIVLAWRSQDKRFNETKRSKYSPFPSQANDLPPLCWLGGLRTSGSMRQNDQNIAHSPHKPRTYLCPQNLLLFLASNCLHPNYMAKFSTTRET